MKADTQRLGEASCENPALAKPYRSQMKGQQDRHSLLSFEQFATVHQIFQFHSTGYFFLVSPPCQIL